MVGSVDRALARSTSRQKAREPNADGAEADPHPYVSSSLADPFPIMPESDFLKRLSAYRGTTDHGIRRAIMDEMIRGNMWMVFTIAQRYKTYGVPFFELVQEGRIGLMKAIIKFNPGDGTQLVTYAQFWIRAYISTLVHDHHTRGSNIPIRKMREIKLVRRLRRVFETIHGRMPNPYETYLLVKADEEQRRPDLEARGLTVKELSFPTVVRHCKFQDDARIANLDDYRYDDSPRTRRDSIPNGAIPDGETALLSAELDETLQEIIRIGLASLDRRELYVLRKRLELDEENVVSLAEVGRRLRVSRERARQLEIRAIRKFCAATGLRRAQFDHLLQSSEALQVLLASI